MYILLTAATTFEIDQIFDYLEKNDFQAGKHEVGIQLTGIGSMMASYELTKAAIELKPDFIIQAGIAGSFLPDLLPPQVVIVKDELLGDLGAVEKEDLLDIFDLGLLDANAYPYTNKRLANPLVENKDTYLGLPVVSGVTVNEISTNEARINSLRKKSLVAIESMEGACLHYIALKNKIPFLQIRAVSNSVGERNKQQWKMQEAITALNDELIKILPQL